MYENTLYLILELSRLFQSQRSNANSDRNVKNKAQRLGETHRCRALLDGYAGCGSPQRSGNTMVVSEAHLGLS